MLSLHYYLYYDDLSTLPMQIVSQMLLLRYVNGTMQYFCKQRWEMFLRGS